MVRQSLTLILVPKNFPQRLEIFKCDDWILRPLGFCFEPGLKPPFATMLRNGDVSNDPFVSLLAPFVFLHRGLAFRRSVEAL